MRVGVGSAIRRDVASLIEFDGLCRFVKGLGERTGEYRGKNRVSRPEKANVKMRPTASASKQSSWYTGGFIGQSASRKRLECPGVSRCKALSGKETRQYTAVWCLPFRSCLVMASLALLLQCTV